MDDGDEEWKLAACEPLTGQRLLRYEHSFATRSSQWGRPRTAPLGMIYAQGAIYQTLGRRLRCLDAQTGELRWEYAAPEGQGHLYRPTLAADLGLVLLVQGPGGEEARELHWKGLYGGRYPAPIVDHVLAVDLETGRLRWRVRRNPAFRDLPGNKMSHEIARRKIVYHVVAYSRGRLFLLFACDANGGGPSLVLCHDARTGEELWYAITRPQYDPTASRIRGGGEMFNLFALDDGTLLTIGHQWARLAQRDGKLLAYGSLGGNARCDTHTCTVRLVTAGFGNTLDLASPELRWTRRDLARGQCGGRCTPAYGMTLHQCSGCKCFFPLRGQMALHRVPPPRPLPDSDRLLPGPATGRPLGPPAPPDAWPCYLYNGERRAWSPAEGPRQLAELWRTPVAQPLPPDATGLRRDWLHTSLYNGPATAPVVPGGLVVVADRDRHRVVALDAATGEPRWTYRTLGRVLTTPTYARGRFVLGTRRGWVHALDAATGEAAWRFFAAPQQRFLVAYG
ncbi:MAG: PQQ-binding-like beta-propeller repeat protein [Candidatus Brocadiia bacterium]